MLRIALILCILVQHAGAIWKSPTDLGTVVLTNIIFRNGDQSPLETYPTDPFGRIWSNATLGQLMNVGKVKQYNLGMWLRTRYCKLLQRSYSRNDIFVQSTDEDYTLMSAASTLAGLYPPLGTQVWNTNVTWQPIPIHTLPKTMDNKLAATKHCPRYDAELRNVKQSEDINILKSRNFELMAYLSASTKQEITELEDVERLYKTLFIEDLIGLRLPVWTRSVFPKKMIKPAQRSFMIPAYNTLLQRLKSGPLLGEVIENMEMKANGTLSLDRKMFMYCGCDAMIANFLMTLGLFKPHCPPYAATIMVELRKNLAQEYIVAVWYKEIVAEEPILLTIPGCDPACPLQSFRELMRNRVPDDWEKECRIPRKGYFDNINVTEVLVMVLISLGILIILVLTCKQCRKLQSAVFYQRVPTANALV